MAEKSLSEFVTYFKSLPIAKAVCRIYERNDMFSIYGEDALLINKKVLEAIKLHSAQAGSETLNYVNITKAHFPVVLKYLLFVCQYKIEIFKNTGTVRIPQWTVCYKASPGNLTDIEHFILSENDSYVQESRGIISIKISVEHPNMVVGVAFCDNVLRDIQICQFIDDSDLTNLQSVLVQMSPLECLLPPISSSSKSTFPGSVLKNIMKIHQITVTECKAADFHTSDIVQDLNNLLDFDDPGMNFNSSMKDEAEMTHALSALACVIKHLELLSDRRNFGQFLLTVFKPEHFAKIDYQSISGLGLFPENTTEFHEKHYLFGHLNRCGTALGERLLVQWIKQPLMDLKKMEERLDIVQVFIEDFTMLTETSRHISRFPDIDTLCRKIQRKTITLQQLYKIYLGLMQLPKIYNTLSNYSGPCAEVLRQSFVVELEEKIEDFENFIKLVEVTLDFDALKRKEFFVKAESYPTLLELKENMENIEKKIMSAAEIDKAALCLPTAKIECDKKFGFCFRITKKEEKNIRHKKEYTIINTKASGVRFQSASFKSLNEEYLSLRSSYEEKQKEILQTVAEVTASYIKPLRELSHIISWLDVSLSFASVSSNAPRPYVRPVLRDKGDQVIILNQCRHPVLESTVENFIPNDVKIMKGNQTFFFVTGPNMGGKSTFIRMVALNVLMAQIGCFVPCDHAEISIVDAIFTRVGASDKPSKAVSTFMHEMVEIQTILKSATSSSLIIIDEMGRGTSTYDGFGLSWAISRHIAETLQSACLFATHFHELTALSKHVPSIGNLYVEAMTPEGDIIFLYNVKPGICNESFGIHVSKLAEFPPEVIKDAEEKLNELNKDHMSVQEIIDTFSNVPDGEVILRAFQEKQDVSSGPRTSDGSSSDVDNSYLDKLSNILEELVKEMEE